ncbi:MAG: hypothetical protein RR248_03820 [Clostridia bacterium]
MRAIFFVLKNQRLLTPLLNELEINGITGGTLINSKGMAKQMAKISELPIFGSLHQLLNDEEYDDTSTLIFIADEVKEKIILSAIETIVGKLDQPNSGIIFAMPVDYTIGLKF